MRAVTAAALLLALTGCSSEPAPASAPPASSAPATSSCPAAELAPTAAQPVDGGTPPAPPQRIELTAGTAPDRVVVRVVAAAGEQYDASQLRVFVNGCAVPFTDEGDELPERTLNGIRPGDRLQVLARLNGQGGNSAETASAVRVQP